MIELISYEEYMNALANATEQWPQLIEDNIGEVDKKGLFLKSGKAYCYLRTTAYFYLTTELLDTQIELCGVFSLETGHGKALLQELVDNYKGCLELNCFDGFLVGYYKQFGFVETLRKDNWTEGGPDVVYMERVAKES